MDTPNLTALRKNLKLDTRNYPVYRVALLGDSATQLLGQALKGYAIERKSQIDLFESDYDQIDLQLGHPASDYHSFQPDYTFIHKTLPKLKLAYYKAKGAEKSAFGQKILNSFEGYINGINQLQNSRIIISTIPEEIDAVFGNFAGKTTASFLYQIRKINMGLMELAQRYEQVFLNDVSALYTSYGEAFSSDRKMYINASMSESVDFLPLLVRNMFEIVRSISGKFHKALILDLDNTTWGGVIGDDGMEGIQIGDLGIGKAFTELQLWAKNLKERGIILGICSKNTESVAREPFEKHPDMVLRPEDISIFVANWGNKADNIRMIQSVLNIGFDSMVFLDDNPFERNLVRSEIPEVTVPELPEDPADYLPFLNKLNLFETASFSSEDSGRTQKYQQEAERAKLKQQFQSIDDYLSSLDMKGSFEEFDDFHLPRISQLTQRSNQYNLRTIRYDEKRIREVMEDGSRMGFYVKLQDNFGEYGLISVLIIDLNGSEAFIDTWLMSCRVLKRDVEKYVLNELVRKLQERGIDRLLGEYIPTPKNKLVENHYKNLGFSEENGKWVLSLPGFQPNAHFIASES